MSTLSPFGDNVGFEGLRASGHEDALIREYQEFPRDTIQITGAMQHNEAIEYARKFKRETPTRRVVYRFGDDDNIHRRMGVSECASWLAGMAQDGLIPSYNNEPTEGTLTERVTHGVQVMRELKARGVNDCIMWNWNTGGIPDLEKRWYPELDEPMRVCREFGYTLGWHDYMNTQFMDDPASPLYCGRYRHVTRRHPGLKVLITEFGFDSHAPNPHLDGYKNHETLWKQMFPGMTRAQVFWQETLKAENAIYAPDDVVLLFFIRYDNGTPRWTSFQYEHETGLIAPMKTYRRKPVATNPTPPQDFGNRIPLGRITVKTTGGAALRVRSSMSTANLSNVVGSFKIGTTEEVPYWDTAWNGWKQLEYAGKIAYVAADLIEFTPVIVLPPPVPQPPGDGLYSPFLTADEINQLADYHTKIAQLYQTAYDRSLPIAA